MGVSRIESLWINVDIKEMKVANFKYTGNVLKGDAYCTRKMKMRISMAKKVSTEKYHS